MRSAIASRRSRLRRAASPGAAPARPAPVSAGPDQSEAASRSSADARTGSVPVTARASAVSRSKRQRSTVAGSTRSRIPASSAARMLSAPGARPGSSARRRPSTSAPSAAAGRWGGASPHTASTRAPVGTASPTWRRRMPRRARWRATAGVTTRSRSRTSIGPRMRNSISPSLRGMPLLDMTPLTVEGVGEGRPCLALKRRLSRRRADRGVAAVQRLQRALSVNAERPSARARIVPPNDFTGT